MRKHVHIGTSGFSYSDWQGLFYPPEVKSKTYLEYYATQFDCVELNSCFYHLPKKEVVQGWYNRTPGDFRFCPKLSRLITHIHKLKSPDLLHAFFNVFEPLKEKLGPVLIQLPPSLKVDAPQVEPFFRFLQSRYGKFLFAVEARHPSWISEEAYHLLKTYQLEWVISDSGGVYPSAPIVIGKIVYLRFHGPRDLYSSDYPIDILQAYALLVRELLQQKKKIWAFFNNDVHGYAVKNAREFRQLVLTL